MSSIPFPRILAQIKSINSVFLIEGDLIYVLSTQQLGKEKFHKSQHFDYSNALPMLVGSEKPGIGGELLVGQKIKPKYSVYPRGEGSGLPAWVVFDKQVNDRL